VPEPTGDAAGPHGARRDAPAYSIVIPSYNSRLSIGELVARIGTTLTGRGATFEVIVVDDASPDPGTWPAILDVAARHPEVRAFRLTRNFGRTAAVLCGMVEARGHWIITMDDDLQHRPEDIPKLTAITDRDAVVAAFPYRTRQHSWSQRSTSRIKAWFDHKALGMPKNVRMSSFIMIRASIVRMMLQSRTPHPFIPALLFHVTRDIVSVPCQHDPRQHGRSEFGLRRRLRLFSNLIINNSSLLLRFIAAVGIATALVSLALGVVLVALRMTTRQAVPGWTSLAVIELLIGGLILFSLGVIGEYLARIIQLAERRPAYFVREASDQPSFGTTARAADGPADRRAINDRVWP
jgi:dolichol-phosphate mannosyltransferase/undecaprenyl-phosphate 4-deoxy-4-formamido-L-arabinose transferase